jgi:hypothetical protein
MPKTYTTIPSVVAGETYGATAHNNIATTINNHTVPPMAQATRTAVQSIANNTTSFVSFTTESFDTDGMFTATDTKITVQTAGVYLVTGFMTYASNGTGARISSIEKNAASAGAGTRLAQFFGNGIAGDDFGVALSAVANLAANDTLHLTCYQTSGGALNTGASHPVLSAVWIGRIS